MSDLSLFNPKISKIMEPMKIYLEDGQPREMDSRFFHSLENDKNDKMTLSIPLFFESLGGPSTLETGFTGFCLFQQK